MAQELSLALPRYVMLKNRVNNRYLRFTDEDTQQHGQLQFTGETVISPYVKFEIEQSRTVRGLVHLRSSYNNKYWVRTSPSQRWIAAAADIPEEDQSKWTCTLFSPILSTARSGPRRYFNFRHVQLNLYLSRSLGAQPFTNFVEASRREPEDTWDPMEMLDWESLVVMPKHVVFKGENGMYLRARVIERQAYLEFSGTSNREATAGNEVFMNPDGSLRMRSNHYGRFWRGNPNWIWGDSPDTTANDPTTVFWPVKVGRNVVALRNKGNNRFCKRLTAEGKTSCLNASDDTITEFAMLEVEERVISRSIYDLDFHVLDGRIYNETVRSVYYNVFNNNSIETNTPIVQYTYEDTKSRSWQSSVAFSYGVTATVSGGIPLIAEGTIQVGWEAAAEYTWGETHATKDEISAAYPVTVGPYTRATVSVMVTEGTCDVPFSYSQRDQLFDGNTVITRMHDGIYTGINVYNLIWDNKEEKLTAPEIKLLQEEEDKKMKLKLEKEEDAKVEKLDAGEE